MPYVSFEQSDHQRMWINARALHHIDNAPSNDAGLLLKGVWVFTASGALGFAHLAPLFRMLHASCLSLAKIERLDISSAMHNPDNLYPVLYGSVENEVVLHDRISQVWADIRPGSAEVLIFGQQQKVLLKGSKQLGGCLQVVCRDIAPNLWKRQD